MNFLLFLLIFILSYVGVLLIGNRAAKGYLLDHPNERSMHTVPTPRGGGLAIVIVVLATAIFFAYEISLKQSMIYIVSGAMIAWMGWRDDVQSLSPKFRFTMQGVIAAISMAGMGYFKAITIPLFGEIQLGAAGLVITFFWIVGLTNAYNFMDGIDGIAGGVAVSAALCWMLILSLGGNLENSFVFSLALAIAAGSFGFLLHNWPPAKIFMGDVASTFLGYSFAVMPLLASDNSGGALTLGTLLMWTFIMDAGLTFLYRLFKGEKVFSAHRSHLYQRMVMGGYSHAMVSSLYIALTLFAGALSWVWARGYLIAAPFIFFGLPLIWIFLSYAARRGHA